ncbi:Dyp-type peroxidase [Aliidiomarina sp. Khilg15.8]
MPRATKAQAGICAEDSLHGLVLVCQLRAGAEALMRERLEQFPDLVRRLDERFSEALLNVVLAFGSDCWDRLDAQQRPRQLAPFPDFDEARHQLASNHFDLVCIIRSDRLDANFFAGRVLLEWFGDALELKLEYNLFHYLDNRNLFGFAAVPDAPHGSKRAQIALLDSDDDPVLAQGSYLYLQHQLLNIQAWQALSVDTQCQIMGRGKLDGRPYTGQERPSHAQKAALQDSGAAAALLWQQMPTASMREHGHIDMLWSRSPLAMQKWLQRRIVPDADGHTDPLFEYQVNTLSAAFFAPPLNWFSALSEER